MHQKDSLYNSINKFDDLLNKMTFNIFIRQPDSSIHWFIKKYFPYLTKPLNNHGWTSYPRGPIPDYQPTIHSLIFTEHPYLDITFKEGRLDIETREEKEGKLSLWRIHLWFMFNTYSQAKTSFKKLCGLFEKVCMNQKLLEENGRTIAEYSVDKKEMKESVYFVMTEDELYTGRYKILFGIGEFNDD
jgi:hypothetical protein